MSRCDRTQKRHLGTYYRVGFYGIPFQNIDMDGKEYIYKEPDVTKLGEISERLRDMYIKQFGPVVQVKLITDSKKVRASARLCCTQHARAT